MTPLLQEFIKQEYHHLDTVYFNTAYFGPSPYSAKQKVSRALQKELDPSFYKYESWMGIPERSRELFAELLGTEADNITHSTSTSDVINLVATGYPFEKGDVVCAIDKDYPSNILPWMRAEELNEKMSFHLLELGENALPTVEWLEEHLPEKTKIFNVSHVTFDTGKKVDILKIGKYLQQRGVLFVLDATQSLGGLSITKEELEVIDVLACSSYKWLLGPYGHAFGYFSDRALQKIHYTQANWTKSPNSKVVYNLLDYTTETLEGARRFDRGQAPNMLAMSCLEASLEFLKEIGLKEVQAYNKELKNYFLENYPAEKFNRITPESSESNILALRALGIDPVELERELKYRNVDVSVRQGNIRLSFHIFNTTDQIDRLIAAINI